MIENVSQSTKIIQLPIINAKGFVLANDIVSNINVPPADNSAMDGYAINATNCSKDHAFTIVNKLLAGQITTEPLAAGECARIMTGAVVPPSTTSVVMQEKAFRIDNEVAFNQPVVAGDNIRRAGDDIAIGDVILTKGTKLDAAQLGLLASIGLASVDVFKPIRVAIFATGDELQCGGTTLLPGNIYESNRIVCHNKLIDLGCEVVDLGIIKDCPNAIMAAFDEAQECCDVIITSGGVSVGDADFVKDVLTTHGKIDFWKIAIKPGKPFAFGQYKSAVFFGLPGNTVATYVTFDVLVTPTLKYMSGHNHQLPITLTAISASAIKQRQGRAQYLRAIVSNNHHQLTVKALHTQGSHMMSGVSQANAYIVLGNQQTNINAGDNVPVILFESI